MIPAATVQRSGQSHRCPLYVEDLASGQDIGGDGGEDRPVADADQHEAVRRHTSFVGEAVDQHGGDQRSDEGSDGNDKPAGADDTIMMTAAVDALWVIPMKSGLASGFLANDWKIAPENPNRAPTSTAVRARGRRIRG